jgi:dienelactone hydrolase
MTERIEITFDSGGVTCAGYLYLPDSAAGTVPCVVMGHGFSGTRNLGLISFAERFAAAGMAVLVFDYAYFGASGGQPRQLLDVGHQLDDYRAAVAFARAQPGIDPARIALWGTSLSGGHVIVVAAGDPRIAAVVSQVPFPGVEFGRSSERPAKVTLQLLAAAASDALRAWRHRAPRLIPVFGDPGDVAVFTSPHDKAIIDELATRAPEWRNAVAARMLFPLMRYQPRTAASRLAMPLLVCIAEKETAASPALTADMACRAPKAEVRRYPIGHFDAYTGQWLERIVTDQIAFLHAHLGIKTTMSVTGDRGHAVT